MGFSMPFLCTPVWNFDAQGACLRSYVDWMVHGWTPSNVTSYGRTTVLTETVFGGFKTVITFKEDFWNWSSSAWKFEDIFEDYYVLFPGSGTPANAGVVQFDLHWAAPYIRRAIVIDPGGSPYTQYWAFSVPPAPADYWMQNGVPAPETPFHYNDP